MKRYILAHSPMTERKISRVEHYFFENISIVDMIKDPENSVPAFFHSHTDFEFIIPETPMPFLYYDDAVYYGEAGYVYPVYSGKEHGSKYSMDDVSYTDIIIDKDYFDRVINIKKADINLFKNEFILTEELRLYLKAFKKEYKKDREKDNLKMKYLTGLISAELAEGCISVSDVTLREAAVYRKGIYSAADYINKNFNEDISVAEIASLCELSESYFTRAFREAIGCSPKKYMLKIRISKAKLLLENTDKLISEICFMCGFKKQNSFTSIFKTMTGMSPNEYRKKVKNEYK